MTVRDFCSLCVDDSITVALWDIDAEVEVFRGSMRNAMLGSFADYDVDSIDPPFDTGFCLNIIVD